MCDLVFLSRYMRPEGPWQRRLLFLYTIFPCAWIGLTGPSGPPAPPTVRKDKGKTKERRCPLHQTARRNGQGKIHSRAGLGPPPRRSPPPPYPLGALSLSPRIPPSWRAKTLNTASVAFPSHRYRTDGALGRSHLKASPMSFHRLGVCLLGAPYPSRPGG